MQRDFSIQLKSIGGVQLVDGEHPITLKTIAVNALLSQNEDEKGLSGEEKYKRFKLADRISASDQADVSAEEISLIKRLVGTLYSPVIVGPVYDAFEG